MAFFLVFVLALALAGGLFFIGGMTRRAHLKLRDGRLNAWQASQVRLTLADWRFPVTEEQENTAFRTLYYYLTLIWSAILTSLGIGFLVAALVSSGVVLAMSGSLLTKVPSQVQDIGLIVYLVVVIASAGGLLRALHQIRREAARGVRFGDLSQRQAADYRSPLVHLLALPSFLLITLSTMLLLSSAGAATLRVNALNALFLVPEWAFWIIPALILAIPLLAEFLIARITRFPRFLVTLAPAIARRYDDMLRAIFIGWMLTSEFLTIGCLTWAQYGLINLTLASQHNIHAGALSALLVLSYISVLPLLMAASLVSARRGRLGGRIARQLHQERLEAAS